MDRLFQLDLEGVPLLAWEDLEGSKSNPNEFASISNRPPRLLKQLKVDKEKKPC